MSTSPATVDEHQDDDDRLQLVDEGLPGMLFDVQLDDGSPRYRIRATNADMVAFDIVASKKKWPDGQRAPFLWATFLAWRASKRTGRTSLTFEQFQELSAEVEAVKGDTDDVPPSRPTPGLGSASVSRS